VTPCGTLEILALAVPESQLLPRVQLIRGDLLNSGCPSTSKHWAYSIAPWLNSAPWPSNWLQ